MANPSGGNYQLSVLLKLQDSLSKGLTGKTLPTLKKFEAGSKSALKIYEQLRRGLAKPLPVTGLENLSKKYRSLTTDARAFAREQGKMGARMSRPANTSGLDAQTQKLRAYRRELRAIAKTSESARTSMRAPLPRGVRSPTTPVDPDTDSPGQPRRRRPASYYGMGERLRDAGEFVENVRQVKNVWRDRFDSLHVYTDETLRLVRAQEKFKAIGLSDKDNAEAFAAVNKQVQDMKGISLTDATESITDLHTALGDLHHAIESLPLASKYRYAFTTLFGDKFSSEEIEDQLRSGFKFLEVTGKVARGREEMERSFNVMAQMQSATGGRVTPADMLLAARRAKGSMQGLTTEGMRNLSAPIQELGPEQTGTALMSMYQALVGGVMKQSAAAEFQRLGLIDTSKIEFGRAQQIKKLMPGANKLGPVMQEDPLKAADMLMDAMKRKGIDTSNANKVREELTVLFGNRNAQGLMGILTTQRGQVVKEAGLAAGAKDVGALYKQSSEGPLGKFKEYEAAMVNLRTEMGQGLLPLMTQFAQVTTPIARFFGDHPTVAKYAMALLLAGKAGSGLLESFTILSRGGKGIFTFLQRAGTTAEEAAAGMGNAERRALGLGGALKTIPKSIQIGLVLGAAWFTLQQILNLLDAREKAEAQKKELADVGVQKTSSLSRLEAEYQKSGEPVPRNVYKLQASGILSAIDLEGTLKESLEGRKSWGTAFHNVIGLPFGDDFAPFMRAPDYGPQFQQEYAKRQAPLLRSRAPELANPNVMAEFLGQWRQRSDISSEGKGYLEKAISTAFPESFSQATKQVEEQMRGLGDSSQKLPSVFDLLGQSAQALTVRFNEAQPAPQPAFPAYMSMLSPTQPVGVNQPGPRPFNFLGGMAIPSRAIGGIVERDGLAMVHAGNTILPAAGITHGLSPDMLRAALAADSSGQASFSFGDIVIGGGGNIEQLTAQFEAAQARQRAEFQRKLNDVRRHDRVGGRAIQLSRERA
jgi:hypothetical protein